MLSEIGNSDLKICQREWNILEDLVRFLRKFREVVEMLSTQKTASLNLALVFNLEIRDILNSVTDDETLVMVQLKNKMLAKLEKRFPITEKVVVAALLDPRFISLTQIDTYLEQKNSTRAAFLAEYIKKDIDVSRVSATVVSAANASTSSADDSLLAKLTRKHSSSTTSSVNVNLECSEAHQECWRYLTATTASDVVNEDILQNWRGKKEAFPLLTGLARAILAIPATSTPSERVFSIAGLTVTAKRSRLSPGRVNKIIFIHNNYDFCKDKEHTQ
uniref:HAT C-terminal dimerisation domain-containing protein n=1 Tax=Pectinophora gossypiella TaxID=13191 RepID=A0A1E1WU83_PECGO